MADVVGSNKAFARAGREKGFECVVPPTPSDPSPPPMAINSTASQSQAFGTSCTIARLFSTVDCFLTFGSSAVVTNSNIFQPGGVLEYYGVNSGWTVAARTVGTSGILYLMGGA